MTLGFFLVLFIRYRTLNRTTTLILTFLLIMSSCVDDVQLNVDNSDSKIFFYSEIEANNPYCFHVYTVDGFADEYEMVKPKDISKIDLSIREARKELKLDFEYDNERNEFVNIDQDKKPVAEVFYRMNSSLFDNPEYADVSATTYIPPAYPFDNLSTLQFEKKGEEQGLTLDLTFKCAVDIDHSFYEIKVFMKDIQNGPDAIYPLNVELLNEFTGVEKIKHRNSIMVDSDLNLGGFIKGRITGYIPERIIASSDHVYFKISAINPEMFRYHITHQKRLQAKEAVISEPVIIYTNIENGLGLFTGYSSTFDSLYIGQ